MAKDARPTELFMPPNILKAKVGGAGRGLDMAAIGRAEAAVRGLKDDFCNWMSADADRLYACRDRYAREKNAAARDALFRASHDIKGQAATFEFPLAARVAASLCRLMEAVQAHEAVPLALVDAHVSAIHIIFRDMIRDGSNLMASELAAELETRVDELVHA
ncbi:MAG TPA: Hpt domain-containing protein [Rhizomicrobium sp.]|nr:Hpt domain-containing protein [Rhizomicrobium sp.]